MEQFFEQYPLEEDVIAAGVSGGADSLALVLRLSEWAKKKHKKVIALTVNHQLREEAGAEADYVAKLMREKKIEHHILVWQGEKPKSNIEQLAREARYSLIADWCSQNNVRVLATGHHRRDQAETFLLRLQRGSGLFGLCGILPVSYRSGLKIIRPQLNETPENLRDYLISSGIAWVEDESNHCEDFQRVKIRHFLSELESKIGLSEKRLADTTETLRRARSFIEEQTSQFIENHVRRWGGTVVSVSFSSLCSLHSELRYQVLSSLLREIGQKIYSPEAGELLFLDRKLFDPEFKGCTLGGCELFVMQKRLWIVPEQKQNHLLMRQEWEKCLQSVPQYAKANLPYKVRRAIYHHLMKA